MESVRRIYGAAQVYIFQTEPIKIATKAFDLTKSFFDATHTKVAPYILKGQIYAKRFVPHLAFTQVTFGQTIVPPITI